MAIIQFEAGPCPPHTPPAAYWILPIAPIFPSSLLCNVRLRGPCFPAIELLQG